MLLETTQKRIPIASPIIPEETYAEIAAVLKSGYIAAGEKVNEFISNFCAIMDIPYGAACNSGTAALHVALLALDIREGDEVITTPFTFIASTNAILYTGARPVFADINPDTFNINPDTIEALITPKTKAILVVHLFGQATDMTAIMAIAKQYDLKVIEDCAQAHLAKVRYQGASCTVGGIGDIGAFSFYPTKNMTTSEGGAVVTRDHRLMERAKIFIDQGQFSKYYHTELGYNFRMTNLAAAVGIPQLKYLPLWTSQRQRNAMTLNQHLDSIAWLQVPRVLTGTEPVWHQYVLKLKEGAPYGRDELVGKLKEYGIGSAVHYPDTVYNQPYYHKIGLTGDCPDAKQVAEKVLSLPVHPQLTETDLEYIINILNKLK